MQRGCGCWKACELNKHTRIERGSGLVPPQSLGRKGWETKQGKKSELTELEESKNNLEDLGRSPLAG